MNRSKTLNVPCFKAYQITWQGNQGVCDASDLRPAPAYARARLWPGTDFSTRVWSDAADVGFTVQGRYELKLFTLKSEEKDAEGEITSWYFTEYSPRGLGNIGIRVFND